MWVVASKARRVERGMGEYHFRRNRFRVKEM